MYRLIKLLGKSAVEEARKKATGKYAKLRRKQQKERGKPMDKKLQNKLIRRFPYLYRGYYKDMQSTCMCWGFACGDGWFHLLWQVSLAIEEELKSMGLTKWKMRKELITEVLAKKWNKFMSYLFNKFYLPKEVREAAHSSWLDLSEEDRKDQAKVDAAIKRRNDGDEKLKEYKAKFFQLPGMRMWWPKTGFEVTQVKEKFGTLRYYVSGYTDEIHKYINMAENLSCFTCEKCGSMQGKRRGCGWIYTSCKDCIQDPMDYTKEEMREWKMKDPMGFLKFVEENDLKDEDFEEGVLDED